MDSIKGLVFPVLFLIDFMHSQWYNFPISLIKDDCIMDKLIAVGKYKSEFNTILGINIESKEIYRSKGLPAHMLKVNMQSV